MESLGYYLFLVLLTMDSGLLGRIIVNDWVDGICSALWYDYFNSIISFLNFSAMIPVATNKIKMGIYAPRK